MSIDRSRLLVLVAILLVTCSSVACTSTEEPSGSDNQHRADSDTETDDGSDTDADDERPDDVPDCEASADEPPALLLTWQQDPTSTMTIDFQSVDDDETPRTSLCLREAGTEYWETKVETDQHQVPHLDRTLHRRELTDLEADTEYVFQVGDFQREYRFRTMPEEIDDKSLQFATGGDTQHLPELFETTNEAVMAYDLDFIVWGGDFAYADGGDHPAHEDRWRWWFETVADTLVYDDGRVVPIIGAIGNHEVQKGYYHEYDDYEPTGQWRTREAPYYYTFFAFPGQPGYGVLDFGDYLSLVLLDSDHTNPVEGQQTGWLQATIQDRASRDVPHIFPVYHVPAFPSHRDFDSEIQTRVRDHWVPVFEEHDLEVVFENHDHTYKRTHPIRDGEVDEDDGIVYIGDGAWGVLPRIGASSNEWYIEEFESTLHGIIVTLEDDKRHLRVVDDDGDIIDRYGDEIIDREEN